MQIKSKYIPLSGPEACCDICGQRFRGTMVDGATLAGPWANMCEGCHTAYGRGIGVGLGQRYAQSAPNSTQWNKTTDEQYSK